MRGRLGAGVVLTCCMLLAAEAFGTNASAHSPDQQDPLAASPQSSEAMQDSSRGTVSTELNGDPPKESPDYNNSLELYFLKNLASDQNAIWASLADLRLEVGFSPEKSSKESGIDTNFRQTAT
jgi:hypothetical protein